MSLLSVTATARSAALSTPSLLESALANIAATWACASARLMRPSLSVSAAFIRPCAPPLPPRWRMPRICGRSSALSLPSLSLSSWSNFSASFGALAASARSMAPSLLASSCMRGLLPSAGAVCACAKAAADASATATATARSFICFIGIPRLNRQRPGLQGKTPRRRGG